MKLRYSPTSPYVRKVWVMAIETGLDGKIERLKVSPINPEDIRNSPNPLGKIPCLETDDGMVLYDSPVVLDYLDTQHGGPRMAPAEGRARWEALRRQALGDGMLENSVNIMIETMRKPERQSRGWIAHNKAALERSIDALEGEAGELEGGVDIGRITLAVALAFVDQSFPDEDWRAGHAKLAAWFDSFNQRDSMKQTVLIDMKDDK